jgi:hypothetical protein
MTWGAVGSAAIGGAVSGAVGGLFGGGGGGGYQPVGPQFGDVLPHAMPWGINAMGLGGTMVDETGRVMGTYLDPRLQAIANNLYMRAGEQTGAISEFDPFAAGEQYYETFLAPGFEKQRLAAENRLLSQGMFGSSGGAERMKAIEEAALTGRQQSMAAAQTWYDQMRQRELDDIRFMTQLYGLPAGYFGQGATTGSNIGAVASGIQPAMAPTTGGFGGGMMSSLAGPLGKAAGDWASGYFTPTTAPYLDPGFAYESMITDSSYYG